jgi:HSP20 family molecular chaperone IbpA
MNKLVTAIGPLLESLMSQAQSQSQAPTSRHDSGCDDARAAFLSSFSPQAQAQAQAHGHELDGKEHDMPPADLNVLLKSLLNRGMQEMQAAMATAPPPQQSSHAPAHAYPSLFDTGNFPFVPATTSATGKAAADAPVATVTAPAPAPAPAPAMVVEVPARAEKKRKVAHGLFKQHATTTSAHIKVNMFNLLDKKAYLITACLPGFTETETKVTLKQQDKKNFSLTITATPAVTVAPVPVPVPVEMMSEYCNRVHMTRSLTIPMRRDMERELSCTFESGVLHVLLPYSVPKEYPEVSIPVSSERKERKE